MIELAMTADEAGVAPTNYRELRERAFARYQEEVLATGGDSVALTEFTEAAEVSDHGGIFQLFEVRLRGNALKCTGR